MNQPQIGIGKPFHRRTGVNALQWDGKNLSTMEQFIGSKCQQVGDDLFINSHLLIGSHHVANVGDWVVHGTAGIFIWTDAKFKAEFEPVDPSPPIQAPVPEPDTNTGSLASDQS